MKQKMTAREIARQITRAPNAPKTMKQKQLAANSYSDKRYATSILESK